MGRLDHEEPVSKTSRPGSRSTVNGKRMHDGPLASEVFAPTQQTSKKRKRKTKARTEASSSSSSSSDREASLSPPLQRDPKPAQHSGDSASPSHSEDLATQDVDEDTPIFPSKPKPVDPEKAFEDFCLRQATKEFANDLDKLRSASDFREGSVLLLIKSLKQGTACFGRQERERVGSAVAAAAAEPEG